LVYGIFGRSLSDILREQGFTHPPEVSRELRGWEYNRHPVRPPVRGVLLPVSSVASDYCPTARDLYLARVVGISRPPSLPLVRGVLYHGVLEAVITLATNLLSRDPALVGKIPARGSEAIRRVLSEHEGLLRRAGLGARDVEGLRLNMLGLWNFEAERIAEAVRGLRGIPREKLAFRAVPVASERRIDGSRVGLSERLSVDAFRVGLPAVFEMKTGKPRESHRLALAGYALAYESARREPVDFGILAYVDFPVVGEAPKVTRVACPIDDGLRARFLEERDRKLEIVSERQDPGVPERCPKGCGFWRVCRRERRGRF